MCLCHGTVCRSTGVGYFNKSILHYQGYFCPLLWPQEPGVSFLQPRRYLVADNTGTLEA